MEHLNREFIIYSAIAFILFFTLWRSKYIIGFFKSLKDNSKSTRITKLEQELKELKRKSK